MSSSAVEVTGKADLVKVIARGPQGPAGGGGGSGTVTSVTAGDSTITIGGTASAPTVAVNEIAESQVTNLVTDLAAKLAKASNLSDLANAGTARTNLGLGTAATHASTDFDAAGAAAAAQAASQPLDSDLMAIAALSTTAYGRALLTLANQAALQAAVGALPSQIRVTSAAYAATVTPNADTTDILNIGALTGNITIANPNGTPVDGQNLRLRLSEDATGGRTMTFDTNFAFGIDVTITLIPTTASAKWEMLFTWNAADSKWRATAIVRGF